jgi:MoaA/NifB/PqqE/SkfB family radical SAM enzyme
MDKKTIKRAGDTLDTLIFFCTSKCNGRCLTCFYQPQLNNDTDISLEQIGLISKTLPFFRRLMISGGEPFLRKDLDRIIKIFTDNNKVKNISIPTNGLLTEDTLACAERIASDNPHAEIHIACSIDGFKATHDKLRGIEGAFDRAVDTFTMLLKLRAKHKNLRVNLTTTICALNLPELKRLGEYFFNTFDADCHYFDMIRGEVPSKGLKTLHYAELAGLHDYKVKLLLQYKARKQKSIAPFSYIKMLLNSRIEKSMLKIQRNSFFDLKKWPITCLAGKNIFVIQNDGSLSACELRPPFSDLKDHNFDFEASLKSGNFSKEQNEISRGDCSSGCTHGCFLAESVYYDKRNLMQIVLRDFFKL